MHSTNKQADDDEQTLQISIDTKATIRIGPFSRGGKNRVETKAADHDFQCEILNLFGVFLPKYDELFFYFTKSKATSDFIVDSIDMWWQLNRERFSDKKNIVINLDNGLESNSRRTQFMKRIVNFAFENSINTKLAYYPPYHSKYNPIERCWGILEQHWNGDIIDSVDTAINFAKTMKWKGKRPQVFISNKIYKTGVKLSKKEMNLLENKIERLKYLEKYSVCIKTNYSIH